jgi:hypothetical protein
VVHVGFTVFTSIELEVENPKIENSPMNWLIIVLAQKVPVGFPHVLITQNESKLFNWDVALIVAA